MTREQAREIARGKLLEYLQGRGIDTRKNFRCLNPAHEDRTPSMSYDKAHMRCHCFGCGASYDVFDLIGIDYGLGGDKEKFDKAYELFGLTIDGQASVQASPAPKSERQPDQTAAEDFTDFFGQAQAALAGSPAQDYLRKRGIGADVAAKFRLGYDPNYRTFEEDEAGQTSFASWRALIIPTSKHTYIARTIDKPKEPAKKNRYRKAGSSMLFNPGELTEKDQRPVFIVEGELDALSVMEAGGCAVGLGSVANCDKLLSLIKDLRPARPLILALDTDEAGQNAEEKLAAGLDDLGVAYITYNPYGGAKDANEALVLDRDVFKAELATAELVLEDKLAAAAEAEKQAYMATSAAAHVQDFLNGIKDSVNTPAISTGFDNLDEILDGGLYEGLYVLGAISSIGKTTLALQMADNLAMRGQDVLIFSLEMARTELIAKSVSRLTYLAAGRNKALAKTTRGITAGSRYDHYSQDERDLIRRAISQYQNYAQHVFIHEGVGDIGVERVKEIVQRHINVMGRKPVVLIDYLQILAPYDVRASDKQNTDKAVLELKRLSRDQKIPVIGISSFNRESYKENSGNKGRVSMTDFKESGAVEYSADVLLGLEFAAAGSKDYSERAEKKENPRQIRLIVLKNRNGPAWTHTRFQYFPLFNYYAEDPDGDVYTDEAPDVFADMRRQKAK